MIVLDTNVLSALMQQKPDAQVVAWLDSQHAESIWISSVTLFEARYGLALLAPGQRQSLLQERFDQLVQDHLEGRVLVFDADAARPRTCVTLSLPASPCPGAPRWPPAMRHFDDLFVPVINPWEDTL